MTYLPWLERAGRGMKLLFALIALSLLASCGSSKKYQEFIPTRILSIGDAMSYMDFSSGSAVNSLTAVDPGTGSTEHWIWVYAAAYGLTNKGLPNSGGNVLFFNNNTSSAVPSSGTARPSPLTNTFRTIQDITTQANALPSPQTGDLVVMSIGMGDIFSLADALGNAATTDSNADALDIGLRYANLADTIYQRGFKHVLIVPAVDYSSSAYVGAQSATYKSNIAALTKALNIGVNHNCYGGCTSALDSKPYPSRAEGVWKFDTYNYMLNIALRTASSVQFDINNGISGAAQPLCVAPLQTCSPTNLYDAANPSLPYYYSGDLFTTPVLHRLIGTYLYNLSRSYSGF